MKFPACWMVLAFVAVLGLAAPAGAQTRAAGAASGSAAAAKRPTYATWINVWIGSDQKGWWKPTDYKGAKVQIDGKWQAIDWVQAEHRAFFLKEVKRAGVDAVVADLTNGWGWLTKRCQAIQEVCAKEGLTFCIAENSHGDPAQFEKHAEDVWKFLAGPDAAQAKTYLQYHGKPLIVCYCIRQQFEKIRASQGPWRSKFNVVWASGEDAEKDKWGWQLDPAVGPVPSNDSMFVTPSVKWKKRGGSDDLWRKSLSWLDYTFLVARENDPEFIIVGSYDDVSEHNGWLIADTAAADPGRQMRDITGALSQAAYYGRVVQWIRGKTVTVPGGPLADGAYRVINAATGKALSMHGTQAQVGAALTQQTPGKGLEEHVWIYHLGEGKYRLIMLSAALSVGAAEDGKGVTQQWDADADTQRWVLKAAEGGYNLVNERTGLVLEPKGDAKEDGVVVVQQAPAKRAEQVWKFEAIRVMGK